MEAKVKYICGETIHTLKNMTTPQTKTKSNKTNPNKDKDLECGILETLFGGATAKILDFLTTYQDYDYSKQDIAKKSDVSMRHTLTAIDKLEKHGLIMHTRNSGNSHMYKLNTDNKAALLIEEFCNEVPLWQAEQWATALGIQQVAQDLSDQTEEERVQQQMQLQQHILQREKEDKQGFKLLTPLEKEAISIFKLDPKDYQTLQKQHHQLTKKRQSKTS